MGGTGVGVRERLLGWMFHLPEPLETVAVHGGGSTLRAGQKLRLLSWNLQFCASRRCHFFYDGGPDTAVPPGDVSSTIAGIAETIRALDPDVLLLQEVDRASARTGFVDQLHRLNDQLDYPVRCSTPYHRAAYVPHPSSAHLGKVDMHLAVLSRFAAEAATRVALPALKEPAWRRAFNLRRAILDVRLPVEGGRPLQLLNTHLSAFAREDDTMRRQVDALVSRLQTAVGPAVLVGDLNLLPPGDDPARLAMHGGLYPQPSPLVTLEKVARAAIPGPASIADPTRWGTYLPPGAPAADRTIDHAYVTEPLRILSVEIPETDLSLSDHRPILLELGLGMDG